MNTPFFRLIGTAAVIAATWTETAQADAPAGRYTVTGGTVLDAKTKLTWQRAQSATAYPWTGAKAYCASAGTILDGAGWRLPTIKELQTLIDYSLLRTGPMIDPIAFPPPVLDYFWSSTPLAGSATAAWYVHFNLGVPVSDLATIPLYVRCVR
jgi:hypothetical protein